MRNVVFLLCFFIALPLFARDVYKWTNEEGVVMYSDTYVPGAERIRVSGGKTSSSQAGGFGGSDESAQAEGTDSAAGEAGAYKTLEIVQPENDATVRSNEGSVLVGLALSPALAEGHSIKIFIDGTPIEGEMKATQFSLSNLNRGTHSLKTQIVDGNGNVIISSNSINFHLRQASVVTP